MRDDWRLTFQFRSEDEAQAFADEAESVVDAGSEVSRADDTVYVYPDKEADAREAERRLAGLSTMPRAHRLERWNAAEQKWQDPALPVEPPLPRIDASLVDLDHTEWVVEARVRAGDERDAWETLWRQGLLVVPLRRRALITAPNAEAADELCATIEAAAPFVRARKLRLTRLRRWWLAQQLFGNYESSRGGARLG